MRHRHLHPSAVYSYRPPLSNPKKLTALVVDPHLRSRDTRSQPQPHAHQTPLLHRSTAPRRSGADVSQHVTHTPNGSKSNQMAAISISPTFSAFAGGLLIRCGVATVDKGWVLRHTPTTVEYLRSVGKVCMGRRLPGSKRSHCRYSSVVWWGQGRRVHCWNRTAVPRYSHRDWVRRPGRKVLRSRPPRR